MIFIYLRGKEMEKRMGFLTYALLLQKWNGRKPIFLHWKGEKIFSRLLPYKEQKRHNLLLFWLLFDEKERIHIFSMFRLTIIATALTLMFRKKDFLVCEIAEDYLMCVYITEKDTSLMIIIWTFLNCVNFVCSLMLSLLI